MVVVQDPQVEFHEAQRRGAGKGRVVQPAASASTPTIGTHVELVEERSRRDAGVGLECDTTDNLPTATMTDAAGSSSSCCQAPSTVSFIGWGAEAGKMPRRPPSQLRRAGQLWRPHRRRWRFGFSRATNGLRAHSMSPACHNVEPSRHHLGA